MIAKENIDKIIVHKPAKLNYEILRRSLGCPPDEIEVHDGDEQDRY